MRGFVTFLGIGLLVLGSAGSAGAVTFTGRASGEWLNVVSSDSQDIWEINNHDSDGLPAYIADFNWGVPATTNFNNQFTFDGIGSDGDPEWSTADETPFLVGNFTYRNGSTNNSAGIDGVDLSITLDITTPLGLTESFTFDFDITNTPNNTGDPVLDGDIVTVTTGFSPATFMYGGDTYTLNLLGFSSDGGMTIRSDFSSPEGANAAAGVYGRITTQLTPDVPEPATLSLLGLGLVGLVLKRMGKRA